MALAEIRKLSKREREKERERECVCVRERESERVRERERERERDKGKHFLKKNERVRATIVEHLTDWRCFPQKVNLREEISSLKNAKNALVNPFVTLVFLFHFLLVSHILNAFFNWWYPNTCLIWSLMIDTCGWREGKGEEKRSRRLFFSFVISRYRLVSLYFFSFFRFSFILFIPLKFSWNRDASERKIPESGTRNPKREKKKRPCHW